MSAPVDPIAAFDVLLPGLVLTQAGQDALATALSGNPALTSAQAQAAVLPVYGLSALPTPLTGIAQLAGYDDAPTWFNQGNASVTAGAA